MGWFLPILQAVLGAAGGRVGGDSASGASPVQSAMGNMQPGPMQVNPVAGSGLDDLWQDVGAGIRGALLRPFYGAAAQRSGQYNRRFLDASFPELNAWEKAGVSAVSPGVQASGQDLAVQQQRREFAQANKLQDKNIALEKLRLAVSERMNAVSAGASVQSASIAAAPQMALLPFNQENLQSQSWRTDSERSAVEDRNIREWVADIGTAAIADYMAGKGWFDGKTSLAFGEGAGGAVSSVMARDAYGALGRARDAALSSVGGRFSFGGIPRSLPRSVVRNAPRAWSGARR